VTPIKVKPAQMDAYLTSLRQASKPLLDLAVSVYFRTVGSQPENLDYAGLARLSSPFLPLMTQPTCLVCRAAQEKPLMLGVAANISMTRLTRRNPQPLRLGDAGHTPGGC
jgi:hypothetical protein